MYSVTRSEYKYLDYLNFGIRMHVGIILQT